MSVISAIKDAFVRVFRNLAKAAESLTNKQVLVTEDGEIVIQEAAVDRFADKVSAALLAGAALFFLMFPTSGKATMAIGDQLMRAATYLWTGGTSEGVQAQADGFAV
jgi:hypothetical protein